MTSMIERVAKAICEVDCGRITENELARCRELARAAIEAMMDPTEGMIIAGIIERHDQPCPEAWKLATANIYQAMLTAALKENGE